MTFIYVYILLKKLYHTKMQKRFAANIGKLQQEQTQYNSM